MREKKNIKNVLFLKKNIGPNLFAFPTQWTTGLHDVEDFACDPPRLKVCNMYKFVHTTLQEYNLT